MASLNTSILTNLYEVLLLLKMAFHAKLAVDDCLKQAKTLNYGPCGDVGFQFGIFT